MADPDDTPQPSSTGSLTRTAKPGSDPRSSETIRATAETVLVTLGDNLWTISRRTYGGGSHYTAIHEANRDFIRDPNLIYPGQILVLPNPKTQRADRTEMHD